MTSSISSRAAIAGLAALAMAGFVACGGNGDSGGGASGEAGGGSTVVIKNFQFEPANLKVAPGAKVTVKNEDAAAHTLTADDRSFDTGNIEGKGQKEITATKVGQVAYKCDIHPYMTGVVQVSGS
ncbi:MAG TPA: cupredoxin domain-containing protein [Acidimicrobiales bacterium]|nr:cupredoxin domain-containing protein [Acidimicrobiales bacterium]